MLREKSFLRVLHIAFGKSARARGEQDVAAGEIGEAQMLNHFDDGKEFFVTHLQFLRNDRQVGLAVIGWLGDLLDEARDLVGRNIG